MRNKLKVSWHAVFSMTLLFGTGTLILYPQTSLYNSKNNMFTAASIHSSPVPIFHDNQSQAEQLLSTQNVNQQRLQLVHDVCKAKFSPSEISWVHQKLITFDNNVVMCRAFKSATTFSVNLLQTIFKCDEKCVNLRTDMIQSLTPEQKQTLANDKFSFFFVREPYSRLFSTYSNKFYLPKEYWSPVGPEIAQRYRVNASSDSLKYGHDVNFRELIQYVVDEFESGEKLDKHLAPIHRACNPCLLNFTFIGKMETFTADWNYLLDTWTSSNYAQPVVGDERAKLFVQEVLSPIQHVFTTRSLLKASTISDRLLFLRTWSYFQMSGLISSTIAMPEELANKAGVKLGELTIAIQEAIKQSSTDKENVRRQKKEALIQAYSTVPRDLLERLRQVVLMDCELFGYEDRPEWLFNSSTKASSIGDFNYFQWI